MSEIVEITTLEHVILFHFQKMMGKTPEMSFGRLWSLCSNAACRMKEQGIANPVTEKKQFARQFFACVDRLCIPGVCEKKEEFHDGGRKQLASLSLTSAGRDTVSTIIFGHQDRAQVPEVYFKRKQYRGPML